MISARAASQFSEACQIVIRDVLSKVEGLLPQ